MGVKQNFGEAHSDAVVAGRSQALSAHEEASLLLQQVPACSVREDPMHLLSLYREPEDLKPADGQRAIELMEALLVEARTRQDALEQAVAAAMAASNEVAGYKQVLTDENIRLRQQLNELIMDEELPDVPALPLPAAAQRNCHRRRRRGRGKSALV